MGLEFSAFKLRPMTALAVSVSESATETHKSWSVQILFELVHFYLFFKIYFIYLIPLSFLEVVESGHVENYDKVSIEFPIRPWFRVTTKEAWWHFVKVFIGIIKAPASLTHSGW